MELKAYFFPTDSFCNLDILQSDKEGLRYKLGSDK